MCSSVTLAPARAFTVRSKLNFTGVYEPDRASMELRPRVELLEAGVALAEAQAVDHHRPLLEPKQPIRTKRPASPHFFLTLFCGWLKYACQT